MRRKWIVILVTVLVLSFVTPCEAFAGTVKPYMTSTGDMEEAGGSYIYVKENGDDSRSLVQKKGKNGKEKILLTEYFERKLTKYERENIDYYWKSSKEYAVEIGGLINRNIITNGEVIFFAMRSHSNPKNAVIYKYNIATGKKNKVKTVKRLDELSGYYNGNLYYCVEKQQDPSIAYDCTYYQVYGYNLKTKKTTWLHTGPSHNMTNGYGRYLSIGGIGGAAFGQNMKYWIFDLKTGSKKEMKGYLVQCAKDGVYYASYSGDYQAIKSPYKLHIKKSSYDLKKTKTIRTWITRPIGKPERYFIFKLGRTYCQYDVFKNYEKTATVTVRYK